MKMTGRQPTMVGKYTAEEKKKGEDVIDVFERHGFSLSDEDKDHVRMSIVRVHFMEKNQQNVLEGSKPSIGSLGRTFTQDGREKHLNTMRSECDSLMKNISCCYQDDPMITSLHLYMSPDRLEKLMRDLILLKDAARRVSVELYRAPKNTQYYLERILILGLQYFFDKISSSSALEEFRYDSTNNVCAGKFFNILNNVMDVLHVPMPHPRTVRNYLKEMMEEKEG